MRASHGEARRGGASSLPSSLSSAAAPPVAAPVVPAGEATNTTNANAEMASLGMTVSSGRGDVVDIVGMFIYVPVWRHSDVLDCRECAVLQLSHDCNTFVEER